MFGIAGTAELSTFCPGTGTWNRLQDGIMSDSVIGTQLTRGIFKATNRFSIALIQSDQAVLASPAKLVAWPTMEVMAVTVAVAAVVAAVQLVAKVLAGT